LAHWVKILYIYEEKSNEKTYCQLKNQPGHVISDPFILKMLKNSLLMMQPDSSSTMAPGAYFK